MPNKNELLKDIAVALGATVTDKDNDTNELLAVIRDNLPEPDDYYTKEELYTKDEVDNKMSNAGGGSSKSYIHRILLQGYFGESSDNIEYFSATLNIVNNSPDEMTLDTIVPYSKSATYTWTSPSLPPDYPPVSANSYMGIPCYVRIHSDFDWTADEYDITNYGLNSALKVINEGPGYYFPGGDDPLYTGVTHVLNYFNQNGEYKTTGIIKTNANPIEVRRTLTMNDYVTEL